jgi:hypothetical protein
VTAPAPADWQVLERRSIVAPLGIRFWDPAFDVQITDGLTVTAYPEGSPRPAARAVCTPGGIFAFRKLAGLQAVECSLPPSARFLIEVTDTGDRFQPVAFLVDAPFKGIFPTDLPAASAMPPPGFYLFSAPTRSASPLLALVRTQVNERLGTSEYGPAAYAVLELDAPDGTTYVGLADASGTLALLFPYPDFTGLVGGASLPASPAAQQQSWPVTLRIRYQPSALSFPQNSRLPELRSVLAQARAQIWTDPTSATGQILSELTAILVYGQTLTLRSGTGSTLLVSLGSIA